MQLHTGINQCTSPSLASCGAAYGAPNSGTTWCSYFEHNISAMLHVVVLLHEVLPHVDLLDECASHFVQIHHNIKCQMLINFPIH